MPNVGGKKYPYTPEGRAAASRAQASRGQSSRAEAKKAAIRQAMSGKPYPMKMNEKK